MMAEFDKKFKQKCVWLATARSIYRVVAARSYALIRHVVRMWKLAGPSSSKPGLRVNWT